jgi:hypothetical protein
MSREDPDTFLTDHYRTDVEEARLLNVTTHTLWVWRRDGKGPPWLRIGGKAVYYRKESTAAWLAAQERQADAGRAVA